MHEDKCPPAVSCALPGILYTIFLMTLKKKKKVLCRRIENPRGALFLECGAAPDWISGPRERPRFPTQKWGFPAVQAHTSSKSTAAVTSAHGPVHTPVPKEDSARGQLRAGIAGTPAGRTGAGRAPWDRRCSGTPRGLPGLLPPCLPLGRS